MSKLLLRAPNVETVYEMLVEFMAEDPGRYEKHGKVHKLASGKYQCIVTLKPTSKPDEVSKPEVISKPVFNEFGPDEFVERQILLHEQEMLNQNDQRNQLNNQKPVEQPKPNEPAKPVEQPIEQPKPIEPVEQPKLVEQPKPVEVPKSEVDLEKSVVGPRELPNGSSSGLRESRDVVSIFGGQPRTIRLQAENEDVLNERVFAFIAKNPDLFNGFGAFNRSNNVVACKVFLKPNPVQQVKIPVIPSKPNFLNCSWPPAAVINIGLETCVVDRETGLTKYCGTIVANDGVQDRVFAKCIEQWCNRSDIFNVTIADAITVYNGQRICRVGYNRTDAYNDSLVYDIEQEKFVSA